MEDDLIKLDALFDSILEEVSDPSKVGTFKNPFAEEKSNRITELSESIAVIMVRISNDSMSAYVTVMSGDETHKPFTAQDILRAASTSGVFYGIDEAAVKRIADEQIINTDVLIASGMEPVNGTDGRLNFKYNISEGKEIPNIPKDAEICHAAAPHAGRDGKDVRGRMLPAVQGENIELKTGDGIYRKGNRYYAEFGGTLVCRRGEYSIVDEVVYDENIDLSSGIIGYGGTVVINGNVTGKAIIRAGRGVVVRGLVSGSVIEAVKDIRIEGRINDSSLTSSEGSIIGNEFYDSDLAAGSKIDASVLDNCTVKCVDGVVCLTGQGRITGGEINCVGDVNCFVIGSKERMETRLSLGDCSEFVKELEKLRAKINLLNEEIVKITNQVNAIREKEQAGTVTLEEKSFLEAALRIRSQKVAEKVPITERIKRLEEIIAASEKATIRAKNMLYGGAVLQICGFTQILNSDKARATVYSNGANIVVT
ncbi:MAG: DUF342 domain-containing protein [Ruminiclostridium sp.]|nr:DUF342 domain-containing protein [Ruminiclostridium sp.]